MIELYFAVKTFGAILALAAASSYLIYQLWSRFRK